MIIETGSRWHRMTSGGLHHRIVVLRVETNHVLVEIEGSKCPYGGLVREWIPRAWFASHVRDVVSVYPAAVMRCEVGT